MNTSESAVIQWLSFFYDHADTRIRDWPFMGSPYAIILAYALYVLLIVKILPKLMENRKALSYNVTMSIVDGILCLRSSYFLICSIYIWFSYFNWRCQPIDDADSWLGQNVAKLSYQFVITKFVYTLQSVVFVVSKKKSPVATYLLIHHTIFPLMLWLGVNFYPGGHITFVGFVNSFVHFTVTGMRLIGLVFRSQTFKHYRRLIDIDLHVSK